ncbi:hypothetical protein [Oceaniglobus roseus]|uniref:hypothetical protein n=1 Tax=Oceaniglobus roseus TaxID=1737570 RepID=UPI00130012F8|nr:hypothetical protein [Kandeliimicrobium roseum]
MTDQTHPMPRHGWFMAAAGWAARYMFVGAFLVALLFAAGKLGLPVNKLAFMGLEFEFHKVNETIDANNEDIENLKAEVGQLRANLAALVEDLGNDVTKLTPAVVRELPTEQGAVTEPVISVEPVKGKGWIWLGSFDWETRRWTDGSLEGLSALGTPQQLVGHRGRLAISVNVRQQKPRAPSQGYFADIPSMGVAAAGSEVVILSSPKYYQRESGMQYWAEVETTFLPKGRGLIADAAVD